MIMPSDRTFSNIRSSFFRFGKKLLRCLGEVYLLLIKREIKIHDAAVIGGSVRFVEYQLFA